MKTKNKTDSELINLIEELMKRSEKIWRRVAKDLQKPTRSQRIVNLFKLSKHSSENEIIVVPGKVLGTGELSHKLTVAALKFSGSAKEKINKNGSALTISQILEKNPKGNKIRIIG